MRLQEWQTDAERVLDQVLDGKPDIPWLTREIRRLEKLRNKLPSADQATADFTLDELQDYLDADEADETDPVDPQDEVSQAMRIRAEGWTVSGPQRAQWLQRALARLNELAEDCQRPEDAKAVRDIIGEYDGELQAYR